MLVEPKPGDLLQCQEELYIVIEVSDGMIYTLDFSSQQIDCLFILRDDQYTIIPKPDNIEWMFIKRRELNSKFITKYRGL